jgi:hypothetical protein
VTTALQAYFHRQNLTFTVRSTTTGTARTYDSLSAVKAEVTEARIVAGLHFRYSMRDGSRLGQNVAAWVLSHHFDD